MKNMKAYAVALLAGVMVMSALAGCGGQTASSDSASASASESASASASESAPAAEATGVAVTDLQAALENAPAYQSVTLTSTLTHSEATDEPIVNVFKVDTSGDAVKSSLAVTTGSDTTVQYLTGDEVVIDISGEAYKGTTEQMGAENMTSVDAYLSATLGKLDSLFDCASDTQKAAEGDKVRYTMTIDPEKVAESDGAIASYAEINEKLNAMTVSFVFDADGRIAAVECHEDTSFGVLDRTIEFTDYDSTVVEPAPQEAKSYEEFQAAINELVSSGAGLTSETAAK